MKDIHNFINENLIKIVKHVPVDYSVLDSKMKNELFMFSKKNALVFLFYKNFDVSDISTFPEQLLIDWKAETIKKNLRVVKRKKDTEEVLSYFQNENIDLMVLKGVSFSECFMFPETRYFTDLDLFVKCEDVLRTEKLLINCGYYKKESELVDVHHDVYLKKGRIGIELHDSIVTISEYPELYNLKYELFNRARKVKFGDSYFYSPQRENMILLCLGHMYRSFCKAGTGIRQLVDLYYIIHSANIDWEYIDTKVIEYRINNFYTYIMKLMNELFKLDLPENQIKDALLYSKFKKDIFIAGFTGIGSKDRLLSNHVADYKIKYNKSILSYILPNREYLCKYENFKYCENNSILLPVAWIHRILLNLKREKIHPIKVRTKSEAIKTRIELMKWVIDK